MTHTATTLSQTSAADAAEITVPKGRIMRLTGEGDVIVPPSVRLYDASRHEMKLVPLLPASAQMIDKNGGRVKFKVGETLSDNTIYIGEVDNSHWAIDSKNLSKEMTQSSAKEFVRKMKRLGHNNWELPSFRVGNLIIDILNEWMSAESITEANPRSAVFSCMGSIWLNETSNDGNNAWALGTSTHPNRKGCPTGDIYRDQPYMLHPVRAVRKCNDLVL